MGPPLPRNAWLLAAGAALLTALLAVLSIIPGIGLILFLLELPAPLLTTWVYLRNGAPWAYGSGAAAVLLAFLAGGPGGVSAAAMALICVLGGLALGAAVQSGARPLLAGAMVTVALVSGMLLVLVAFKLLLGGDFLGAMRESANLMAQGNGAGALMPTQRLQTLQKGFADTVIYLFPAFLVISTAVWALALYVMARWTLARRFDVAAMQPFAEWRTPRWVPWLFVPGLLLWLLGMRPASAAAARFGDNYLQVMNVVFEVQGLSVVFWWLRKRLGRLTAGTICAAAGLLPPAGILLMMLGVWDALMDFRKLDPRPGR